MKSYLCVDAGDEREVRMPAASSRVQTRSAIWNTSKLVLGVCSVALLVSMLTLSGCASQQKVAQAAPQAIEIESVRITAAGHYVDLRYRVLDPALANSSLGPGVKPTLIDEASGISMGVPTTAKLGSLRQTKGDQRPDRTYFVLFANTAGLTSGSKVTAQMGDMKFEGLTVE